MQVNLPISTEVLEKNDDLKPVGQFEENKIVITLDTRKRDYKTLLHLPRRTRIEWINERTFEVQELSSFAWPIVYRITTADGYYQRAGQRVYFTPQIAGLSPQKKVSDLVLRLGVFLSVIVGLGCRQASWLMASLFQVTVSKSALHRWLDELAAQLPTPDQMVKLLATQQPITQAHLDELFPLGTTDCVLVLKDEHGRIIATEQVSHRDEAHITPFLERLQKLGLNFTVFYIDHCQAFINAIAAVYPQAEIQFDYFHILQNIWRHLWGEFRTHRRDLKARGEAAQTPWYARKLKRFATQLWQHRYLFFKADEHLTPEEQARMQALLDTQPEVNFIRRFLHQVWAIFEGPQTEAEAYAKFAELKESVAYQDSASGFTKAVNFASLGTQVVAPTSCSSVAEETIAF